MTIQPYQQRVIDELKDLEDKLARLVKFIDDQHSGASKIAISESDFSLLVDQQNAMQEYANVLRKRVFRFEIDEVVK